MRYVGRYRCEAIQCRGDNIRSMYRRVLRQPWIASPHFINYVSQVRWRLRKDGGGQRPAGDNPRRLGRHPLLRKGAFWGLGRGLRGTRPTPAPFRGRGCLRRGGGCPRAVRGRVHSPLGRGAAVGGGVVPRAVRGAPTSLLRISEAPAPVIAKPPPHLRYVPLKRGEAIHG
ncbi:MAG: hypothetical protein LBM98_00895 [Oscillospiraceae bacterium]|nr:hypothetical protein [Oscillospiraceae bacterium]